MQTQTIDAANWWARPRGAQAREWIATYQNSLQARHRTLLVDLVGAVAPSSVLEVGCHCGPNLIRLCETFPAIEAHGVDANTEAVQAGTRWAETRGLDERIELKAGPFPDVTRTVASGAVDLVLTCYALAYVAPADLHEALYEIGRLAKRAVMVMEPMVMGPAKEVRSASGYAEWAHDYAAAAEWVNTLRGWAVRRVPVSPPVDRLNGALVLTRCS
jgi:ubiquinone/menaquinone biosynthesis C-methylase UbiE